MPLSEHEQRLLDEMERNLYRHDADVVSSVSGAKFRPNSKSIVWGVLGALAGIALVVAGVMTHQVWLGVLGFVAVLAGVLAAMRPAPESPTGAAPTQSAKSSTSTKMSFMDRMNDRWDRRSQL